MKDITTYINESEQVNEDLLTAVLGSVISGTIYAFFYWYSEEYLEKHLSKIINFFGKNYVKIQNWVNEKGRDKALLKLAQDKEYQEFTKNNPPNADNFEEWKQKYGELIKQKLTDKEYKLIMAPFNKWIFGTVDYI